MSEREFFWLVGLLEGEGCFQPPPPSSPRSARIQLKMVDLDIVTRAANLLGGYKAVKLPSQNPKWQDQYGFKITGDRAVWLMVALYPHMGLRRRAQIKRSIEYHPAVAMLNPLQTGEELADLLRRWATLR